MGSTPEQRLENFLAAIDQLNKSLDSLTNYAKSKSGEALSTIDEAFEAILGSVLVATTDAQALTVMLEGLQLTLEGLVDFSLDLSVFLGVGLEGCLSQFHENFEGMTGEEEELTDESDEEGDDEKGR